MRGAMPVIGTALLLAACGEPSRDAAGAQPDSAPASSDGPSAMPPTAPAPAAATPQTDAWVGKWVGVEGLALEIAKGETAGRYALKVTLLDGTDDYIGTAAGDTIRFDRDGQTETIRAVRGSEIGLKWLSDKDDCLMIQPGEGFCRG